MKTIYNDQINESDLTYIQENIRMFAIDINKLKLDSKNARMHKQKSLDSICASLKKFGQQTPIVFDENFIVKKGNGTLQSAKILGWKYISAFRSNLKGNELDAWAIADNKTTQNSSWNTEVLSQLLSDFENDKELIDSLGFDQKQIDGFLGQLNSNVQKEEQDTQMILKMELRPYESYDYIMLLCDNTYDWNFLNQFFDIKRVSASYVNSGKVGLGRGVKASLLVEKLKEYQEEIEKLKKELENK